MSQVQPKKRRVSLLLGFCNAILAVSTFAVLLLLGSPLFPGLVFSHFLGIHSNLVPHYAKAKASVLGGV